jgi:hypothetical protein
MDVPLLEQLARLLAQGRRDAQRLLDATGGRYRERAVVHETVRRVGDANRTPHRLLCGDPALALAALCSERRHGGASPPDAVVIDLHPARQEAPCAMRFARWIPRFCLLQALAPQGGRVSAPAGDHAALRLVLDATWPFAVIEEARATTEPMDTRAIARGAAATTLVIAEDATRFLSRLPAQGAWIACTADALVAARLRRSVLATPASLDIANVGATPGEWARRHVGTRPVDAMHAALEAFGATPLLQTTAGTTPSGRRRAGMEVLLGTCVRDGVRTLVWVDAPDRRTSDATLCRAITRRDVGAPRWDRVVVLGWHFASTFAQHLALRSDGRIEAYEIQALPRPRRACVADDAVAAHPGFRAITGLTGAWIERDGVHDHEWIAVQLHETARPDAASETADDVADWSIDPDHDGEVFRGRWHASRDGHPGVRAARLCVPWRAGPRRVCVRAIDGAGRLSEVVMVVRHRTGIHAIATRPAAPGRPAHSPVEALC